MTKVQINWTIIFFWFFIAFFMLLSIRNATLTIAFFVASAIGLMCGVIFMLIEYRRLREKTDKIKLLFTDTYFVVGLVLLPTILLRPNENIGKLIMAFLAFFIVSPAIKATLIAYKRSKLSV